MFAFHVHVSCGVKYNSRPSLFVVVVYLTVFSAFHVVSLMIHSSTFLLLVHVHTTGH